MRKPRDGVRNRLRGKVILQCRQLFPRGAERLDLYNTRTKHQFECQETEGPIGQGILRLRPTGATCNDAQKPNFY